MKITFNKDPRISLGYPLRPDDMPEPQSKEELEDKLCQFCPLDKKGVYSVPGGYMAGCEGSRCEEAYENYLDSLENDQHNG